MKPGTIVKLPDGREGTVVYHGLEGYGIRWGRVAIDVREIERGGITGEPPAGYQFFPEAMLRDPYPGARLACVGGEFEVVT